jgi:hypothetical protein
MSAIVRGDNRPTHPWGGPFQNRACRAPDVAAMKVIFFLGPAQLFIDHDLWIDGVDLLHDFSVF